MSLIFSRNADNVGVVQDYRREAATPVLITISDPDFGSGLDFRTTIVAATTAINIDLNTKVQLNESLSQDIFMLVFGEQVRAIKLGLLVFEDACVTTGGRERGIKGVMSWWERNNLSARKNHVIISIGGAGGSTMRAYISNLSANIQDPEERIWLVSIGLIGIPSRTSNALSTDFNDGTLAIPSPTPGPVPGPFESGFTQPNPVRIGSGGVQYSLNGDPVNLGPSLIPLEGGYRPI
jgi:hypothetical protein